MATRYRSLLRDESTFEARTLEELVTSEVLGDDAAQVFGERYL